MQSTAIRKHPCAPGAAVDHHAAARHPRRTALRQLHRDCGSVGLTPYHKPAPIAGTAVTVRTRGGDNLAILRAFEFCRPGDVMVIDAGGDVTNAVVGGILSFYAASIGTAGMVIDGAIRDVAEIRERTYPVYARGVNHRGPFKDGPGEINVPVSVGGMVVNPGDIVVGDQDGSSPSRRPRRNGDREGAGAARQGGSHHAGDARGHAGTARSSTRSRRAA